jgi:phosphatidylserine/phosphatidylglycerophosphate/cardiolipin synthase-like enzyme
MNRWPLSPLRGLALAALVACAPAEEDIEATRGGRVDVYFNEPGSRESNMWHPDIVDLMVETIDSAKVSIDLAVMGFSYDPLIDALERAWDRGVAVRMVGDAGHLYNDGYQRFIDRQIPMVSGNLNHIMHNKYMVVDGRFIVGSTANWTDTDLIRNSNNFFLIDSPPIAAAFSEHFQIMFDGRFGYVKPLGTQGRAYQVGDTIVEVWFAPREDVMGRILELVDATEETIRFTIFAFTKDQLGSAFIRKHDQITGGERCEPASPDCPGVVGVIDQSQLHSNGQYHEAYRLLSAGLPLRMDGNDNSKQPGDYQAGGGRLHSKTMLLDAQGAQPVVISGSFNWSASATQSNDEFLVIFRGVDADGNRSDRISSAFDDYFRTLWAQGRELGHTWLGRDVEPGDIVINEVMWYGRHDGDEDGNDEYIELRNMTDRELKLDMWSIRGPNDFIVGLPPGSTIPPNGLFTILDHTLEPYQDGVPQDQLSAFRNGDLVVNPFNDNRQARLYLKGGTLEMALVDPFGRVMDEAGNGGPAFFGGPSGGVVRSMERLDPPGDGTVASSWAACPGDEGGENVNEAYKGIMIGTPSEPNRAR